MWDNRGSRNPLTIAGTHMELLPPESWCLKICFLPDYNSFNTVDSRYNIEYKVNINICVDMKI